VHFTKGRWRSRLSADLQAAGGTPCRPRDLGAISGDAGPMRWHYCSTATTSVIATPTLTAGPTLRAHIDLM